MSLRDAAIAVLGARPLGQNQDPSRRQPTTRLDNTVLSRTQNACSLLNRVYPKPKTYFQKVIKSGSVIEIYEYEKAVLYNKEPQKVKVKFISDESVERSVEYKNRNAYKSRNRMIRLAITNFTEGDKLLTLTFDNNHGLNVSDIQVCNWQYKLFIRRLSRKINNLKYITRIEFQDKNNRGAVHYHIICNLPYTHWKILTELWGFGGINIRRIYSANQAGAYVSKYMSKSMLDDRYKNHRRFFYSKNLKKPIQKIGVKAKKIVELIHDMKIMPTYETTYESTHNGMVSFTRYNLASQPAHQVDL